MPETPANPIYSLDGVIPKLAADAFVAPTAALIGDVEIGPQASIWFGCVLRGDIHFIRVGARSNIQDGTIVHTVGGVFPTVIGEDVTIGHAAILHGCTLANRAFVGMGATVLDGAVIEEGGVLAAGGLLAPGKVIGPNELWMGAPARLQRVMPAEERAGFDQNAIRYVKLAARFRQGLGK
ncbi:MAG: gamma carbonic anhydrase family protein [Acetobacteraceae bacterium]|nr:gamma carbonic anhydrase family protein [Acetobacteraceae bacterium]